MLISQQKKVDSKRTFIQDFLLSYCSLFAINYLTIPGKRIFFEDLS